MNHSEFERLLLSATESLGIDLQTHQQTRLFEYFCLFQKWNAHFNLSAIRDEAEVFHKHFADSLSIVPLLTDTQHNKIIDVGTGGGLPGIVLAICFPERQFTLLDSAGKKMRFLFQVKQALDLNNVELHQGRVEQFQPQQPFNIVLCRAFSSLKNITDWCQHLLEAQGEFWAMKGNYPEQELREIEKHYTVAAHHVLPVPKLDGQRCLMVLSPSTKPTGAEQ